MYYDILNLFLVMHYKIYNLTLSDRNYEFNKIMITFQTK